MARCEDDMTRTAFPLEVEDISALARNLHRQITDAEAPLTHLALMNMLVRGAGYRNFQHLRALSLNGERKTPPSAAPDMMRVTQVLRYFDVQGRLTRWPGKTSAQKLALWALWIRLTPDRSMTEQEVSGALNRWHLFGDAAILRRTLVEMKLVTRSPDCSDYRRVGQAPPSDARALIRAIQAGEVNQAAAGHFSPAKSL
jgi:hypothetical protein